MAVKADQKSFGAGMGVADLKWRYHSIPWHRLPVSSLFIFFCLSLTVEKLFQLIDRAQTNIWVVEDNNLYKLLRQHDPIKYVIWPDNIVWAINHMVHWFGQEVVGRYWKSVTKQNISLTRGATPSMQADLDHIWHTGRCHRCNQTDTILFSGDKT